jgi:hypothetical protein
MLRDYARVLHLAAGLAKHEIRAQHKETFLGLPWLILWPVFQAGGSREDCRDFVGDVLLSTRCLQRGYFKADRIRHMIATHQSGECSYGSRVYALLMLELWHREYVDGTSAACQAGKG